MSTGLLPPPNPSFTPGLSLLGIYSATAGASIDVVTRNQGGLTGPIFQSDFDEYELEFINFLPATNGTDLYMYLSADGGSTYIATNNFYTDSSEFNHFGATAKGQGVAGITNPFKFGIASLANTATYGMKGTLKVYNPLSTSIVTQIIYQLSYIDSTGIISSNLLGSGIFNLATAINACKFAPSAGNVTGTILVYGKAKSAIVGSVIAPSAGAWTQIAQVTAAGSPATINFSSIPGTYNHLKLIWSAATNAAGTLSTLMYLKVNNDATAGNYTAETRMGVQGTGAFSNNIAASADGGEIGYPTNSGNVGFVSVGEVTITDYAKTTFHKRIVHNTAGEDSAGGIIFTGTWRWKSTVAVTQLTAAVPGTTYANGSIFTLYGIL